ncbi:hypothetical protein JW711_04540 [Candidatus Woesearchaeota archaeon]|nr:hypothetical protein [Candidatus Woesearchaeota archaeon]
MDEEKNILDVRSIDGVADITNQYGRLLYAKTPKTLDDLKAYLGGFRYKVRDVSSRRDRYGDKKPSREVQEKKGWAVWEASINRLVKDDIECNSCHGLQGIAKIVEPVYCCKQCGEPLYVEFARGGPVHIYGRDDIFMFIVQGYDVKRKSLNLYLNIPAGFDTKRIDESFSHRDEVMSLAESVQQVDKLVRSDPKRYSVRKMGRKDSVAGLSKLSWESGEEIGRRILSVYCPLSAELREGRGSSYIWNHSEPINKFRNVWLFDGKRFDSHVMPLPRTLDIVEAWHWAPIQPGKDAYKRILQLAGIVEDKSYYYQDGRPSFFRGELGALRRVLEEFTSWRYADFSIPYRVSGPELVDIVARMTGHGAHVETAPNFANTMILASKLTAKVHGANVTITDAEIEAGREGIKEAPESQ